MPESKEFRFGNMRLESGVRLHFAHKDEGRGDTPVLFLHGYVDSWRSFEAVLDCVCLAGRIVVPDLRGHGDSDKPACCYGIEDYALDLSLLMDALGLDKVDLVGHSMGSFIAQFLAARYPERVGRLVLISSAPCLADKTALLEIKPSIEALKDPIPKSFAAQFQMPSNPVSADFMDGIVSQTMKVPAHVWRCALSGLLQFDHGPLLGRITVQTLLLWGNQDPLVSRRDQEALLSQIAGSRLKELDTGHCPHWEKPEETARVLKEFLS
ncbi:MAG: alpha/beta fold hydrolase [Syntrophobacteraceae bacterium]